MAADWLTLTLKTLIKTSAAFSTLLLASVVAVAVKRRWFSPVSSIPGPFLGSFSVLWQIWNTIKGHTEEETIALHKKYGMRSIPKCTSEIMETDSCPSGDFVRIAHNEVSVAHPDAIRDVLKSHMDKVDLLPSRAKLRC